MTTGEENLINRTTRNRMGKGLAIIIVLIVIGAGIHFAFSSEWNSYIPASRLPSTPPPPKPVDDSEILTGVTHDIELRFVESTDFMTLGFDAIKGEEGANPDIEVKVGDEVEVKVINDGNLPHAFGVVSDPDDPSSILFDSAIGSVTNPVLRGTEDMVKFTTKEKGEYYYICTVPGHATQGMKGKFIVE